MIWICRVLLLLVYSLYWGGLTFYTGIVLRISHDVLNDPMDGGLITQRVTGVLQILGVVAASLMLCNCFVVVRRAKKYGYALLTCTVILGCSLVGLFLVHGQLDAIIDIQSSEITDRVAFDAYHQRYNQLTTVQWLASLAYLPITLFAWRSMDTAQNRRI